jgi:hypothetical protein
MALTFLTSEDQTIDIVITCDKALEASDEQKKTYLSSGKLEDLGSVEGATKFTIKALSPSEREHAEVQAGAYSRSELGRLLWVEAPVDPSERARWHHALSDDEREAMASYEAYLSRVYLEMIKASLVSIDDEEASLEQVQAIRPDSFRVRAISELVAHIQRISLLGIEGK